jgi:hypothetical protein
MHNLLKLSFTKPNGIASPFPGGVIRDYAADLAIAVKKGFGDLLTREKSPRDSVLEAESSHRRHDSTSFLDKILFP